jgi:hypothetical protein
MGSFAGTAWKRLASQKVADSAAKDKVLCGHYNGAMLPKCKGKKYYEGLLFDNSLAF